MEMIKVAVEQIFVISRQTVLKIEFKSSIKIEFFKPNTESGLVLG